MEGPSHFVIRFVSMFVLFPPLSSLFNVISAGFQPLWGEIPLASF